ncbi:hypothetical protein DID80_07685, partial [Candidatus Marinamargulisbacteria bacterium SCGC AAA071-K20]
MSYKGKVKVFDEEIGLYYFNHRFYDPSSMKFLSKDPAGMVLSDPRTINRYTFVNNNPLRYYDPDGRFWSELGQFGSSIASHSAKNMLIFGSVSLAFNLAAGNDNLGDAVLGGMMIGAGYGAIQGAHYGRNAWNKPGNADIAVDSKYNAAHKYNLPEGATSTKYTSTLGFSEDIEIELNGQNLPLTPENEPTFNFWPHTLGGPIIGFVGHGVTDV